MFEGLSLTKIDPRWIDQELKKIQNFQLELSLPLRVVAIWALTHYE